jgi:hypothetical protein
VNAKNPQGVAIDWEKTHQEAPPAETEQNGAPHISLFKKCFSSYHANSAIDVKEF